MSLFVILMFLFTAVSGDDIASFTVRHGDDVTLPCGNMIEDQTRCDKTSWLVSRDTGGTAVELVTLGIVRKDVEAEAERLSVTEDCSLVIKNVKRPDVGRYTCRQFRSGKQVSDAPVLLNVIDITSFFAIKFVCQVLTYGACVHTVQWYYKGDETDILDHQNHPCTAFVTFKTQVQKSNFEQLLFCNVTDQSGQTLLCKVNPGLPCEKTGEGSTSAGGNEMTQDETLKRPGSGWIRFISVSVGLAVLIIISVTVSIWARTQGNKTQTDQNSVENDKGEASVIYENSGGPDASVRFQ